MEGSSEVFTNIPLLDENKGNDGEENIVSKQTLNSKAPRVTTFLSGSCIGALFSVLGFHILLTHQNEATSYQNMILFSLSWSLVTSTTACALFGMAWSCLKSIYRDMPKVYASLDEEDFQSNMQFYYVLGVFMGFCSVCTINDIVYGIPWTGIALTVAVTVVWTLVVAWCSYRSCHEERKGPVLPLVVV